MKIVKKNNLVLEQILQDLRSDNKELRLIYNNFGTKECKIIFEELKKKNTIQILEIKGIILSAESCGYFLDFLKSNESLKELILEMNNLRSEFFQELSEILQSNQILKKLHIRNNSVEREILKIFNFPLNSNNIYLTHLDLFENQLEFEGSQILSEVLMKNQTLVNLNLGNNKIGNEGCRCLCEGLKVNPYLQTLGISQNKIGNLGFNYISEMLKVNSKLSKLDLSGNKIENEGIYYLNETLKSNHAIREINLEGNRIDDSLLVELKLLLDAKHIQPIKIENSMVNWNEIIFKKKTIKVLIINNCKLKGLPIEINELQELTVLNLEDNQLTEIPNIFRLNKLITFILSRNKIKVVIREDKKFSDLCALLDSRLSSSIKHFNLDLNEGLSREMSQFISKSVYYSLNIILNEKQLEQQLSFSSEVFFWMSFINNVELSIERLLRHSRELKELNFLDLRSNNLSVIPNESGISVFQSLCVKLILLDNKFSQFPENIYSLTRLKSIRLQKNNLSSISENISKLINLKELSLEQNSFREFPIQSLSNTNFLQRVWLDKNSISDIPMHYKFSNLQRLSISQNQLTSFGGIIEWDNLQYLFLNENNIETIPKNIKNLTQLKKLHLNKNRIRSIPFSIGELKELIDLQLEGNLIEEIPISIGELKNLEKIDFSNNQIKYIPSSIGLIKKLNHLNVKGNPIISPPIEFTKNLNILRGYWKDLLMGEQKCNYLKLIIVGEENVGKTTLVNTLIAYNNSMWGLKKYNLKSEFTSHVILSTDGIDISIQPLILKVDKSYSLPNNRLHLNLWDFGGQEVYHSTHIFFLSSNSIYLVVWNMNKESEIDRIHYWIQTIQTYVNNPMLILVGTHLDCLQAQSLRTLFETISMQTGISKEYIVGVSCKTGANYCQLIHLIKQRALGEESDQVSGISLPTSVEKNLKSMVGQLFPKMYFDLKKIIDEENEKRSENNLLPVLKWKEFKLIAEKSNIVGEELKRGLLFLHCLGFCLYFSKDPQLSKYVIINSQWLADTMSTLITTKGKFIKDGILDHQYFNQVWKEPKYPAKIHPILFELLQKFQILIPMTHDIEENLYIGKSIVPALISNLNKPNLSDWNEKRKIEIQRIYKFSFLPNQIFPQFMATIFSLFGRKGLQVWRDGILIKKKNIISLIQVDYLNRNIILSFIGKQFLHLFRQLQVRLDMVLNKWENLNREIYVTCPHCSNSILYNQNKCFKFSECFEKHSKQVEYMCCPNGKKVFTKKLLPELDISEVKKIIEWNEIEIEENKIGEGSFADVYKGKYDDTIVAVKKLKLIPNHIVELEDNDNDEPALNQNIREFLLELGFLTYGNHDNLLNFIGIVLSPPCIILPFAEYGSLFNLLHANTKIEITLELAFRIALDIILGLNYLHSLVPAIIHCDLKSENVLIISTYYKEKVVCKITDFGLAQFSVGRFFVHKNLNPIWAAPEVIMEKDQSICSDIYSYGIILYEILTKKVPYSIEENPDWYFMSNVKQSIKEGVKPIYSKKAIENNFKTEIPDQVYEIMESCWNKQPKHRPNSKSIITIFYSLLSNYWKEIERQIVLPLPVRLFFNLQMNGNIS